MSVLHTPLCNTFTPGSVLCSRAIDTRFSVEDIEGALLKQLKASKDTGIVVKKPEEENIRITTYGNPLEIAFLSPLFFSSCLLLNVIALQAGI